jgi:hypothetical protein
MTTITIRMMTKMLNAVPSDSRFTRTTQLPSRWPREPLCGSTALADWYALCAPSGSRHSC